MREELGGSKSDDRVDESLDFEQVVGEVVAGIDSRCISTIFTVFCRLDRLSSEWVRALFTDSRVVHAARGLIDFCDSGEYAQVWQSAWGLPDDLRRRYGNHHKQALEISGRLKSFIRWAERVTVMDEVARYGFQ